MKKSFGGKIVILGCGSVAACTLPLLLRDLHLSPKRYTVVDFLDNRHLISHALNLGVKYLQTRIVPETMADQLASLVAPGDILIDLAWNIGTLDIVQWCHDHHVLYLNTSVEEWSPYEGDKTKHPRERTLYHRHQQLAARVATWENQNGPTAVIEHGANPGLVSHLMKEGLLQIGQALIKESYLDGQRRKALERALADEHFAKLALLTGTKTVHISERDTQIIQIPKKPNEFVNTWSVDGLYEEAIAPAELGWGSHEKQLPPFGILVDETEKNHLCVGKMGMHTWVRTWVPSGEAIGMVIRHGEAYTISRFLTLREKDRVVYSPTVHYAYCPSDATIASLHELSMRQYKMQPSQRIVNDEIVSGKDELGVLLMGHDYKAWWTGSVLSIEQARNAVPHQNATTLQVSASVVGAVLWMIDNPAQGLNTPEDLPHRQILAYAKPYLGEYHSSPVDWTPLQNRAPYFMGYSDRSISEDEAWQFTTFLI